MNNLHYIVKEGLVFAAKQRILSTRYTDEIARANGFMYAEHLVEQYEGGSIEVDPKTLKVLKFKKEASR